MARRSRVRVKAGDSRGRLIDPPLEATEATGFFLSRWRRGVCSVVAISSVTPVVRLDGLAVWPVGEGGAVDSGDNAASLRAREYSTMCV
jgi:hypothetical protein